MDISGERGGAMKDRKWCELQKAVKCNRNKANWLLRSDEKILEAQLRTYREQRKKSLKLLDWRKNELERRFADATVTRHKHADESQKGKDISGKVACANGGNIQAGVVEDTTDKNMSREPDKDGEIIEKNQQNIRENPGSEQQFLLPGRRALAKNNIDHDKKKEIYLDVNTEFKRGLTFCDSIARLTTTEVRKVSSWEDIPKGDDRAADSPDVTRKTVKLPQLVGRSRSYTVSETSNVYIPTRERKKSVYPVRSNPADFYDQRDSFRKESRTESSLEEQFEKLQNCRYLRNSVVRK